MVDIGTLRIRSDFDSAGLSRGITAASSSISAFVDAARLAADAIRAVSDVSRDIAEQESLARSFNLSRQEYERFRLAVSASLGDFGEARDLLGDFQEAVALLGRGEERELRLFRELGFDVDFARRAQQDLTGSFDEFLRRIRELDEVAARGVLTELIGADASRNVNQLARSYGRFADALGRPLVFATDGAVESLNNLRVATEGAELQLRESLIQALDQSGLGESLASLISSTAGLASTTDILEISFTRLGIGLAGFELGLQQARAAFGFDVDPGRSLELVDQLQGFFDRLDVLLQPGRQAGGAEAGLGGGGAGAPPRGTAGDPISVTLAGAGPSMALPPGQLAFMGLTPEEQRLARELGFSVAEDFTAYMQDTLRPALESAFGPFIDERINVTLADDMRLAADQITLLGQIGNNVFSTLRREANDWQDAILSVFQTVFNAGISNLFQGAGFFGGGGLQFGGTVYRSGSYVVGERGPERVFLPRGAEVLSNSDLAPSVTFYNEFNGDVDAVAVASMERNGSPAADQRDPDAHPNAGQRAQPVSQGGGRCPLTLSSIWSGSRTGSPRSALTWFRPGGWRRAARRRARSCSPSLWSGGSASNSASSGRRLTRVSTTGSRTAASGP